MTRLATLSAAGRVSEMTRAPECLALMRLVLRASAGLSARPGAEPDAVLPLVHGPQAVGATLCYGDARRTRYLLRERSPGLILIRTVNGKESAMTREALGNLIRGYRFTDVFVTPVPQELLPAVSPAPAPHTADEVVRNETPAQTARNSVPLQSARPAFGRAVSRWQPGAARGET